MQAKRVLLTAASLVVLCSCGPVTIGDPASGTSTPTPTGSGNPTPTDSETPTPTGTPTVSFATDVQPILDNNCNLAGTCHGGNQIMLDYNAIVDQMGANTCVNETLVVSSDSAASALYLKMNAMAPCGGTMPPTGMLQGGEPDVVMTWIDEGALDN